MVELSDGVLMRISDDELERRLQAWGAEYSGAGVSPSGVSASTGPSTIATIIDHHGFAPDSQIAKMCAHLDSEADEVEGLVLEMRRQGMEGIADSECLRARYARWSPNEQRQISHVHWVARFRCVPPLLKIGLDEYLKRVESARMYIATRLARRRRLAA